MSSFRNKFCELAPLELPPHINKSHVIYGNNSNDHNIVQYINAIISYAKHKKYDNTKIIDYINTKIIPIIKNAYPYTFLQKLKEYYSEHHHINLDIDKSAASTSSFSEIADWNKLSNNPWTVGGQQRKTKKNRQKKKTRRSNRNGKRSAMDPSN